MHTLWNTTCRPLLLRTLVCIASATLGSPAFAFPIAYQVNGTASGTLGGSSFVDAAFNLVGTADTSAVHQIQGLPFVIYTNQLQLLTVAISGLGTFAATAPFSFFVNQTNSVAGFNDLTAADAFNIKSSSFATYTAGSTFPANSVLSVFTAPFATNNGNLVFSSTTGLVFLASAVPESSRLVLMGFGLMALLVRRAGRHCGKR